MQDFGTGRTKGDEAKDEWLVAFGLWLCSCVPGNPAAKLCAHPCCRMQRSVVANFGATSTADAGVATCKRGCFIRDEVGPKAHLWFLKRTGAGRTCWLVVWC